MNKFYFVFLIFCSHCFYGIQYIDTKKYKSAWRKIDAKCLNTENDKDHCIKKTFEEEMKNDELEK